MRIYHNPGCGTSRTVLGLIREAGIEPEVFEYLKTPPDREHLSALFDKLGLTPRDVLRRKGTTLETLGMDEAKMSEAAILDAMVIHPILLERPIVVVGEEAHICRPAERIKRFLNADNRSPPAG